MKTFVTGEDVQLAPEGGEVQASPGAVVTPWARELAATRGVRIVQAGTRQGRPVVALGADHGGYPVKERIKALLAERGYGSIDHGTHSAEAVDYPDFAAAVAESVASGRARFGVVVDGAGIGSAMAANKVPGVRAATCHDVAAASNAREHNDANVLSLGAGFVDQAALPQMIETFLTMECSAERHTRRVAKIDQIEARYRR